MMIILLSFKELEKEHVGRMFMKEIDFTCDKRKNRLKEW